MISKAELCQLIPHAGAMCLLDGVEYWDGTRILCRSNTHLLADNPLRKDSVLSIVHGIEYGAQAMAVHGGLLAQESGQAPMPAYLVSLKNIHFSGQQFLSCDQQQGLKVEAEKVYASQGSLVYIFRVACDKTLLLSGEAMVIQPEKKA